MSGHTFIGFCIWYTNSYIRGGASALGKQPKSVASASDGTVFVSELQQIEVYKQCQKITEVKAAYGSNGIDVSVGGLVAVGGDVSS